MSSRSIWREGCRIRAVELAAAGWRQKDIAAALGASPASVCGWLKKANQHGIESLRQRPIPGAPRKLNSEQLKQIPELLALGTVAHGYRGEVWTGPRVAHLIHKRFGVSYTDRHAIRLLDELGYSPQKPERRAVQRNEEAIQEWREQTWPALKKGQPENEEPSSS